MNVVQLVLENLLAVAAASAFFAGVVFAKVVFGSSSKKATDVDPRDYRIRELETDLRVLQRKYDEAHATLEIKIQEYDQNMMTIMDLNTRLAEQGEEVGALRTEMKSAVAKTRELRQELTERAAETIREHVRAEEAQTELDVMRAGSDALDREFKRMQEKVEASDEEESSRELLANEEIFDTSES